MSDQQPTPRTDAVAGPHFFCTNPLDFVVPASFARQLERELATLGAVVQESQPWRGELAARTSDYEYAMRCLHDSDGKLSKLKAELDEAIAYAQVNEMTLKQVCRDLRQANERLEKERDFAVRDLARAYSSDDKIRREISSQRDSLALSLAKCEIDRAKAYGEGVNFGSCFNLSRPAGLSVRAAREPLVNKARALLDHLLSVINWKISNAGLPSIGFKRDLILLCKKLDSALAANQEKEQG